jgi:hypothetical protein
MPTSAASRRLFVVIPIDTEPGIVVELLFDADDAVTVIQHAPSRAKPVRIRSARLAALADNVQAAIAAADRDGAA